MPSRVIADSLVQASHVLLSLLTRVESQEAPPCWYCHRQFGCFYHAWGAVLRLVL